jgi:hypothetical protein
MRFLPVETRALREALEDAGGEKPEGTVAVFAAIDSDLGLRRLAGILRSEEVERGLTSPSTVSCLLPSDAGPSGADWTARLEASYGAEVSALANSPGLAAWKQGRIDDAAKASGQSPEDVVSSPDLMPFAARPLLFSGAAAEGFLSVLEGSRAVHGSDGTDWVPTALVVLV